MRRGEVWLINLDPTVGAEITETRPFIRTVIIPRFHSEMAENLLADTRWRGRSRLITD